MQGTVLSARNSLYDILLEDGRRTLVSARGKTKASFSKDMASCGPIVAGDQVVLDMQGNEALAVREVLQRSTLIEKSGKQRRRKEQSLIANASHALVVFAADMPRSRVTAIDHYLISVEYQSLEPILVFNKWDLHDEEALHLFNIYKTAGYTVLQLKALGDPEVCRKIILSLDFNILYVCGPSGVGKTSLLNTVIANHQGAVSSVNQTTGKGRHTTTHIEIVPIDNNRFIADTPGIAGLLMREMTANNLKNYYREFISLADGCKFQHRCLHQFEPDCAVIEAVGNTISTERYESYLTFLQQLQSEKNY